MAASRRSSTYGLPLSAAGRSPPSPATDADRLLAKERECDQVRARSTVVLDERTSCRPHLIQLLLLLHRPACHVAIEMLLSNLSSNVPLTPAPSLLACPPADRPAREPQKAARRPTTKGRARQPPVRVPVRTSRLGYMSYRRRLREPQARPARPGLTPLVPCLPRPRSSSRARVGRRPTSSIQEGLLAGFQRENEKAERELGRLRSYTRVLETELARLQGPTWAVSHAPFIRCKPPPVRES
jgi:hypothetical protein